MSLESPLNVTATLKVLTVIRAGVRVLDLAHEDDEGGEGEPEEDVTLHHQLHSPHQGPVHTHIYTRYRCHMQELWANKLCSIFIVNLKGSLFN